MHHIVCFILLVLFSLSSPCLAAGVTDTTVVPFRENWLERHDWLSQSDGHYIVDVAAVTKFEKRSRRLRKATWVLAGIGGFLSTATVSLMAIGIIRANREIAKNDDYLAYNPEGNLGEWEGYAGFMIGTVAPVFLGGAAATAVGRGIVKSRMNKMKPYTITPKISRNGGGLEASWRL